MAAKATKEEEYFSNRKEAHDWLTENGFVISRSKFYEDCKKGFPAINADKSVSKYQVSVYGSKLKDDRAVDLEAMEKNSYSHRKDKADAELAEMRAERMRREEDDQWLHADTAWSAVAALLGRLRESIRHQLHTESAEMVLAVSGEVARSPELFEMIEGAVDAAYNEIAGDTLDITWE